ncbi:hypothetical protein GCM10008066_10590 [Oxalicibacterium faecigallinarum]|uniref:Uncharacterized protein n=1 Tax=Oxalicibacterium faecigallinarum TaxID=573741 RepID=A0A8J3AS57_9BURK|nr:hypothetical protein [Oxalicibacterium faecigallinarum]GGI17760.1 hypothetical protein GCM10008066_10590 [Oxalicibacterium faecigallinarum]
MPWKLAAMPSGQVSGLKMLSGAGIICGLIAKNIAMEAERLNSLQSLLTDLSDRAAELRRYL